MNMPLAHPFSSGVAEALNEKYYFVLEFLAVAI